MEHSRHSSSGRVSRHAAGASLNLASLNVAYLFIVQTMQLLVMCMLTASRFRPGAADAILRASR